MFQIGEFSRLGRVTIETLRHYDAQGLLKPAKVDPFTGYRYYTASQLKTLNRIMALKDVGFTLEAIARILQEKTTGDELRGMLKAQLALAECEMESANLRRERILSRLKSLTLEEDMPEYEVVLKSVEALTIAAVREIVPAIEEMPQRCSALFEQIARWMLKNNLPFGPSMTIYHMESYVRENIDMECAFIIPNIGVEKIIRPEKPIVVSRLKEIPFAATTVVTSDFFKKPEGLTPAYNAIAGWMEDNGYRLCGPTRELFHGSLEQGDLTAEIQFPVEKI